MHCFLGGFEHKETNIEENKHLDKDMSLQEGVDHRHSHTYSELYICWWANNGVLERCIDMGLTFCQECKLLLGDTSGTSGGWGGGGGGSCGGLGVPENVAHAMC